MTSTNWATSWLVHSHIPEETGNGAYLPLVGAFLSFNELVETLNQLGHKVSFTQVPREVYAGFFPGG